MKKRYSQHGSHAGSIPGLVQVSKNTYAYSGFTIRKTPRNAFNRNNTYHITRWNSKDCVDNYYGRDFAIAEATRTVDSILRTYPKRDFGLYLIDSHAGVETLISGGFENQGLLFNYRFLRLLR